MPEKVKELDCEEIPPWMITFADVMTLMLTFFILLVSMSTTDARRKLITLGSIIGTFGFNDGSYDVYSKIDTRKTVEPGPIDSGDLEPLQALKWEDVDKDIDFRSNKFVQILTINANLLFGPSGVTLSPEGIAALDSFLPLLTKVQYPLLIAGHTSELRDELGLGYEPGDDTKNPDLSWKLSLHRSLAVYQYLLDNGMNPAMLKIEAFGKYAPHYNQNTEEGRRRNRRVDIVLDKRSIQLGEQIIEMSPEKEKRVDTMSVDGFEFDISTPAELE